MTHCHYLWIGEDNRMNRIFQIEDFKQFNGFYGKGNYRLIVLLLYKNVCASCGEPIEKNDYHVAHIIPRTHPALMEKYYPGLDVDNLLNLRLSCPPCNYSESNFVLDTPVLAHRHTHSARVISERLASVLAQLGGPEKSIELGTFDPRICVGALHLGVDELRAFSIDWHGALIIPRCVVETHIQSEMLTKHNLGPDDFSLYSTIEEAVSYFDDHFEVDGTSKYFRGRPKPGWQAAISSLFRDRAGAGTIERNDAIDVTSLRDGIYLDVQELNEREGLLIPLRTGTQRWFCELFSVILHIHRKVRAQVARKGYVVLDEEEWGALSSCSEKLAHVESGLGIQGKRVKLPEEVPFGVNDGKIHTHGVATVIPADIEWLCHGANGTFDWAIGFALRRVQLKRWLERAFALAEQGIQQAIGSQLVKIEGDTFHPWVASLPYTIGKTRDEVCREADAAGTRHRKRQAA
jgi:5-methylcytosine-specific restriction endonuclease McrA